MKKRGFGELEVRIAGIIRQRGEVTVRDVFSELGSGSYTTVMTVMSRMAEKGELSREKQGKLYIYRLSGEASPSTRSFFAKMKEFVFGGNGKEMMSYLLENDPDISEGELMEMETMIREYRRRKENG